MIEIPFEWQDMFSTRNLVCASSIIGRSRFQRNAEYHSSFKYFLDTLLVNQYFDMDTAYSPNQVGTTALEMFRNSWYHGRSRGRSRSPIETAYWYDTTRCVVGMRDGGGYFTLPDTKLRWESAHKSKDFQGIKSTVKNVERLGEDYGDGNNVGSGVILSAPFLLVDVRQGALFVGFEGARMNK